MHIVVKAYFVFEADRIKPAILLYLDTLEYCVYVVLVKYWEICVFIIVFPKRPKSWRMREKITKAIEPTRHKLISNFPHMDV